MIFDSTAELVPNNPEEFARARRQRLSEWFRYIVTVLAISALVFTVYVLIYSNNEVSKWKKSEMFTKSLADELDALGNTTGMRIFNVEHNIEQMRTSFTKDLSNEKSSSSVNLDKFRQNFINVQNDILPAASNEQEIAQNGRQVEDSMKARKTEVWEKFRKFEEKLEELNSTRNRGACPQNTDVINLVLITTVIIFS